MWIVNTICTSQAVWSPCKGCVNSPAPDLHGVNQITSDGECIFNAAERARWDGRNGCQALLNPCSFDPYDECHEGYWLMPRRCGRSVVFLPPFSKDHIVTESPDYVTKRGAMWMPTHVYEQTRRTMKSLPPYSHLSPIKSYDALHILIMDSHSGVLNVGEDNSISIDAGLIVARQNDAKGDLEVFSELLSALLRSADDCNISELSSTLRIPEFYIDVSGFPCWRPIAFTQNGPQIHIEPSFIIQS